MTPWSELLETYFTGPAPVEAIVAYHRVHDGKPAFTGSLHSTWAGPSGEQDPNVVTSDDLVAVTFLSMKLRYDTVWDVLVGRRDQISAALRSVPADVPLWAATDAHLAEAQRAWTILRQVPDSGSAFTSKLLARKRPHLVPISDSVIRRVLGGELWLPMRSWLQNEATRERLQLIRNEAGVPDLPLLRVVDIVIWMTEKRPTAQPLEEEDD